MGLRGGTTVIDSNISQDREQHYHYGHLKDHIPKTNPYDVALRCDKDGNVPQIQFNDDGVWHDFAPEGRITLHAGPWFPLLGLSDGDRVSDLRVDRPRPPRVLAKFILRCQPLHQAALTPPATSPFKRRQNQWCDESAQHRRAG